MKWNQKKKNSVEKFFEVVKKHDIAQNLKFTKEAGKLGVGDKVRAIINGKVSSLSVQYSIKVSGQSDIVLIGFTIGADVLPFEYYIDQEVTLVQ